MRRALLLLPILLAPLAAAEGAGDRLAEVFPGIADPLMGDYVGRWAEGEDVDPDIAAQVIPLGRGKYRVVIVSRLAMRAPIKAEAEAEAVDGRLAFEAEGLKGVCDGQTIEGGRVRGERSFSMKRFVRSSPTMGKPAPEGAVVLFDGTSLDAWDGIEGWEILPDGTLMVTPKGKEIKSKQHFGDVELHAEFRTPYMPAAKGQSRGNSGVFVQDVYEVQVLDSYGLPAYYDECGALYKVAPPMVNAAAPPLEWQTYDIDYRAPRFDANGAVTEFARMTVLHNGIVIHRGQDLPQITAWKEAERLAPPPTAPGPIKLQGHNNYVQFRNIWAVAK